ncbi:adenylate/guanylate cyclase domain-containing protein [Bradyrhizobium sp. 200]|nr:adenylate/guanylate cyclase domain-containing protein [Bradyrhizobium sp. 200]
MAADVAGSCRLIGIDEEGTLAQLKALRKTLFDPKIAEHHGRVVKNTGDGALVEFASVVDAVRCADEIQRGVAEQNTDVPQDKRIEFRIGIHIGDIIIADDDIFGDGVNIAVRLEGIAEPGGICISDDAHRQVRGKVESTLEDMGAQTLKNIAEPMRVWRIQKNSVSSLVIPAYPFSGHAALPLPDGPSIAILPFQNMSGDPDQDYFADGMVDEITTALSRFKSLFVIARNSSFTYKGKAVDIKQVGRELGVSYVLEGSVRKAAGKVRIIGQLIDAATGMHLWADRFDGGLGDIFDLQDQVTESVVGAIAPAVIDAEIERAKRKPTESLDAYALYLRGLARLYQFNREANDEALRLFYSAIERDPNYAYAYGRAASCYADAKAFGWISGTANEGAEVTRLAQRAVELGKDDAIALALSGWGLAYVARDLGVAAGLIDRAIMLNSNLAGAWYCGGWVKNWLGEPGAAIGRFARAMRLNPLDPRMGSMRIGAAHAHFFLGRYDEAASLAAIALQDNPDLQPGLRVAAASNAMAGRPERAHKQVARLRLLNPTLRVSNLKDVLGPYRHPEDLSRYEEGLRRAGLPE